MEDFAMPSPGRYVPVPTAGINDPNDLPPPIVKKRFRNRKKCTCPQCGYLARRHDIRERPLHHIGDSHSGRPIEIMLTHSIHYCCKCKTYFNKDLFDNRFLFVQKVLTASECKTFNRITRGFPELRKLRAMVDLVYGLYDRRCKRSTALAKLQKLRERLRRFDGLSEVLKKIESPTVDRSLLFLDDKKLPSTSNAVERVNRRFRKMQKTVYRVRTYVNVRNRIALDMFRDLYLTLRYQTIQAIHQAREG